MESNKVFGIIESLSISFTLEHIYTGMHDDYKEENNNVDMYKIMKRRQVKVMILLWYVEIQFCDHGLEYLPRILHHYSPRQVGGSRNYTKLE